MKQGSLRPWVHAGMPAALGLYPWIGREGMLWASGAAVLLNLFVLPRTSFGRALRREGEPPAGGLVTYPMAVFLLFLVAEPHRAAMAWLALAVADPLASVLGRRFGTTPLPWNRRKTVFGFLVVGWASLAVLAASHLVLQGVPGSPLHGQASALTLASAAGIVIAAGGAAIVESLPLPLDDNLPFALTVGVVLTVFSV